MRNREVDGFSSWRVGGRRCSARISAGSAGVALRQGTSGLSRSAASCRLNTHCGAFGAVEDAALEVGAVSHLAHLAAEGVDLWAGAVRVSGRVEAGWAPFRGLRKCEVASQRTSWTSWLLAGPPTAGLHGCHAILSRFRVRRSVRAPILADARAACFGGRCAVEVVWRGHGQLRAWWPNTEAAEHARDTRLCMSRVSGDEAASCAEHVAPRSPHAHRRRPRRRTRCPRPTRTTMMGQRTLPPKR